MKRKSHLYENVRPALIAVAAFVLLFVATVTYTNYKKGLWEKDIRTNLMDVLVSKKSRLEKSLYSRIYYTRGVAAFVALKPGITSAEYYELAREYIKKDTVISSMALSPNCVLRDIFPLEGHEAAIGLNLLEHPERKEIVEKTIETHQTYVAGPVELIEGGIAFLSYTPIFDKSGQDSSRFWGVTDIVIRQEQLFNEARFKTTDENYRYALRGYNGAGDKGAVFWGSPDIFDQQPVKIHIDLPLGNWTLAAVPLGGWNQYPDQDKAISFILLLSSFIISVLIWLFSRALLKINQNEKDLTAIFGSMDNLIVEYSSKGEYLKIAPTNNDLLYKPAEELLGKNVSEVFDKEKASVFLNAIRKCIETKKLVVIEYPLDISGKESWFLARIFYKGPDSVIFNAFDITEKRNDEQLIKKSQNQLKELNEMKDKFFSILAHDLRNPVGTMKTLSDLLMEDFDELDEAIKKEIIRGMRDSSSNLHLLLEDLLEWSRSQSGRIVVRKQRVQVRLLVNKLFHQIETAAALKEISLINECDSSAIVLADQDYTGIVLRNLLSNAIKFTARGGKITVSTRFTKSCGEEFCEVSVSDTGVGIEKERIASLFRMEGKHSTPGTENEHGTGFGLVLCNELIEKQGGKLRVKSEPGKGSTFSFTLPAGSPEVIFGNKESN